MSIDYKERYLKMVEQQKKYHKYRNVFKRLFEEALIAEAQKKGIDTDKILQQAKEKAKTITGYNVE